ncbi:hypothetical protein CY34DRAFT_804906 [Suillus luteus UH-Slu-Lm8-n1]|uniref:Uncharacterized protein n=1 Tax=Suillus luteus UH-Slu-Lm8-n1 TaxID=930992 RepID=A0A0D0AXF5_9AGAM|nr:hypothetical protein CY34DRAFT_804906 [Suillus luteus UH-Slu-Lm8-n1]
MQSTSVGGLVPKVIVPVPVPQKEVARLNHKSLRRPRIFLFGKSCVMSSMACKVETSGMNWS